MPSMKEDNIAQKLLEYAEKVAVQAVFVSFDHNKQLSKNVDSALTLASDEISKIIPDIGKIVKKTMPVIPRNQHGKASVRFAAITAGVAVGAVAVAVAAGANPELASQMTTGSGSSQLFAGAMEAVTKALEWAGTSPGEIGEGFYTGVKTVLSETASSVWTYVSREVPAFLSTCRDQLGPVAGWASAQRDTIVSIIEKSGDVIRDLVNMMKPTSVADGIVKLGAGITGLKGLWEGVTWAAAGIRAGCNLTKKIGKGLFGMVQRNAEADARKTESVETKQVAKIEPVADPGVITRQVPPAEPARTTAQPEDHGWEDPMV